MHDDIGAGVGVDAGRITADDHREPVRGDADSAQGPKVVMVEADGLDGHPAPTDRRLRFGSLSEHQSGEWVFGVDGLRVGSTHPRQLAFSSAGAESRAAWIAAISSEIGRAHV